MLAAAFLVVTQQYMALETTKGKELFGLIKLTLTTINLSIGRINFSRVNHT